MRILVVEDDFVSRKLLQKILMDFGECEVAVNGKEAVEAFEAAFGDKQPYDLICLDIMMPEMDGQQALKAIRSKEKEAGIPSKGEVKIIMTTALDTPRNIIEAYYRGGCTSYLVKPIDKKKLLGVMREIGLIQ